MKQIEFSPKDEQKRSVYTLNTWMEPELKQAREYLENGYYVHFGSTCIGHTLANYVSQKGIELMHEEYGDRLEAIWDPRWGYSYAHLKGVKNA